MLLSPPPLLSTPLLHLPETCSLLKLQLQLRPYLVLCRCQALLRLLERGGSPPPYSSFASCKALDGSAFATKLATAKLDGGTPDSWASLSRLARTATAPLHARPCKLNQRTAYCHQFILCADPDRSTSFAEEKAICTYINKREPLFSSRKGCTLSLLFQQAQFFARLRPVLLEVAGCVASNASHTPASKHSASRLSNSCAS